MVKIELVASQAGTQRFPRLAARVLLRLGTDGTVDGWRWEARTLRLEANIPPNNENEEEKLQV